MKKKFLQKKIIYLIMSKKGKTMSKLILVQEEKRKCLLRPHLSVLKCVCHL